MMALGPHLAESVETGLFWEARWGFPVTMLLIQQENLSGSIGQR